MHTVKQIFFIALITSLVACGGGGGGKSANNGGSDTVSNSLLDPKLHFKYSGSIGGAVGGTISNSAQASELSTGIITYSSNNLLIATVDDKGVITLVGGGNAVITAKISSDNIYREATTTINVISQRLEQEISFVKNGFKQEIGSTLTNSIVDAPGSGKIIYSSSNKKVATVDEKGEVTIISAAGDGSAIITATKEADAKYAEATANYSVFALRLAQKIQFNQAGILLKTLGSTFSNVVTGPDVGEVAYSSDNPLVATVDNSGKVSVVGNGRAVINAYTAVNDVYTPSSANYVVSTRVEMALWIGNQNTIVNYPPEANGASFFRSSDTACDFSAYMNCSKGQMNVLDGLPILDTAATLTTSGKYLFQKDNEQSSIIINGERFSPRHNHSVIEFKGLLWLIGGYGQQDGRRNDVWSSEDGIDWTLRIEHAAFPAYFDQQVVSYNNKLWLIGGDSTHYGRGKEVWSSVDGINWIQETDNAAFPLKSDRLVVVYKNKLWLIGGLISFSATNDIWSSDDGINWVLETENASFPARSGAQVIVFNNKLWLISGGFNQDIWSSTDGRSWNVETNNSAFGNLSSYAVAVHNEKLWIVGGSGWGGIPGDENKVWSSVDGVTREKEINNVYFNSRQQHTLTSFHKKLLVVGGFSWGRFGGDKNDIWQSEDGITWLENANSTVFSGRHDHSAFAFDDRLWVVGGVSGDTDFKNDVWSSGDGISWIAQTQKTDFDVGNNKQFSVLNNEIFLNFQKHTTNEVWCSADGANWQLLNADLNLSGRNEYRVTAFNNKLWLIGGDGSTSLQTLFSEDGITWAAVPDTPPFKQITMHQLIAFNNKLWVLGGYDGNRLRKEAWSTTDGINWKIEQDTISDVVDYFDHVAISKGKLWVLGRTSSRQGALLSSPDGINWTSVATSDFLGAYTGKTLTSYQDRLFLIGGAENYAVDKNEVWSSEDGIEWRKGFNGVFNFSKQ